MKILYVTTSSLTMNSFFKPHIEMLVQEGHQVDLACNYSDLVLDEFYAALGCEAYQIDFSRSPLSIDNLRAYRQLKKLIENEKYDIVHCHTPNASVITRLVCRKFRNKTGLKVFYTAHGFHFYKGAPKLNWMVFYPIEKFCSRFTDKLITINTEDYKLAQKKFKAKEVHYVPGVGIDFSKFENLQVDRNEKRREIGVPEEAVLLLSVGELNENKNHQLIIKSLARINDLNIHYAIVGKGDKAGELLLLARKLGVENNVHLLGYRNDIPELNYSADIFCFPSIREGLGIAVIEAMACCMPVIVAHNRGTNSFIIDHINGLVCRSDSEEEFAAAIVSVISDKEMAKKIADAGKKSINDFNIDKILNQIDLIYCIYK